MKRIGSQLLCITVLFASVVIAAGQPSPAERALQKNSGETPAAATLFKLLNEKVANITESTNDPKWRAAVADSLHAYCESVLTQVPRNTPDEDKWVENESKDLEKLKEVTPSMESNRRAERQQRLQNSVEYARAFTRFVLDQCSAWTTQITKNRLTPPAEALVWTRLSALFLLDERFYWPVADKLGLISLAGCRFWSGVERGSPLPKAEELMDPGRELPDARDRNGICRWNNISLQIITNAVAPLLEAQK